MYIKVRISACGYFRACVHVPDLIIMYKQVHLYVNVHECTCNLSFGEVALNSLPANGKDHPLKAICKNSCAESAEKEPCYAVFGEHLSQCLWVCHGFNRSLFGSFEHANAVRTRITDNTTDETNEAVAHVSALRHAVKLGQLLRQIIMHEEPWVVSHPRGTHGCHRAMVQL